MLTPRPYQEKIHQDLLSWFRSNPDGNPVVSAATGSGKAYMIARLTEYALTTFENQRVLMLVHTKELAKQNFDHLKEIWPDAPAGILSAGLGRKDIDFPIIFGTIGTMANYADEIG